MSISAEEKVCYLREAAIVLAKEGFQLDEVHTDRLCILLDGAPLCEVTESGGIAYRNKDTAAGLAEHIGDYILTPEISSPQEAAIDELNFTMDAHSAELLLPHVNLFTYGNEIIKDDNAALTSYGLLHREDYQPMQTPVQETQEQAMTME